MGELVRGVDGDIIQRVGRPSRVPTKDGELECADCHEMKHISLFGIARDRMFWHEEINGTDVWYPWPRSYCLDCDRRRRRDRARKIAADKRMLVPPWDGVSVPTEAQVAEMLRRKRELDTTGDEERHE